MRKLAVAGALVLTACGEGEHSADGPVGNDGNEIAVRSAHGSVVYQRAGQEAAFPAFAPRYPGAIVTSTADFAGVNGASGKTYTQQSKDSPAEIIAFYKKSVEAAGLEILLEQTEHSMGSLVATEQDDQQSGVMISVVSDPGGDSTISLSAGRGI